MTSATSKIFGDRPWIVVSANLMALLFGFGVIWLALGIDQAVHLNLLVCLLGALLGWGLAVLATPLTHHDRGRFSRIFQGISAFASGYVVSKLDRFLEATLFVENGSGVNTGAWLLLGLFSASLLVMAIIVFINRSYHHGASNTGVE